MNTKFSGSGPGAQTADGCSVELYRQSAYRGELDAIRHLLPANASVLELGCGTGRLTQELLEFGTRVTAVDNSSDMLAHVPAAATRVRSDIKSLDLKQRFDVVLLASFLVNHPDAEVRKSFVAAASRHAASGGKFLLECHDPQWLRNAKAGPAGVSGGIALFIEAVNHRAAQTEMTLRYELNNDVWRHSFCVEALDEATIENLLQKFQFKSFVWLGKNNRWLSATAT